ncbi:MAG: inositol monophosphatase [Elusimicrobia bacterium]|nr:inositol monophosphatase [Elusimicrobiota bacterium]
MSLQPSTSLLVKTLTKALHESGVILKRSLRAPIVSFKGSPVNIVTSADQASEKKILRVLRSEFPDHGFLTEESGAHESSSPYRWIIDPLDGTVNFAHGLPHCCVSIGLEKNGKMLLGGVYDPFKEEMFLAVRDKWATCNGRRIRVSRTKQLIGALLVTGFPYDRQERARYYLSFVESFMTQTQGLRRYGAAALDMAYIAAGRFDGYWEFNLKPWDVSAGWLLVEEAGGKVSDFKNQPYRLDDTRQTLCTNGLLHADMLKVLEKA